jgi:hypothetical protein
MLRNLSSFSRSYIWIFVLLLSVIVTGFIGLIIRHVHLLLQRLHSTLGLVTNTEDSEFLIWIILLLKELTKRLFC